jgi:hypothetical protein
MKEGTEMEAGKQYEINYGYIMTLDGWVNSWDRMPDAPGEYLVEDHAGHRFTCEATVSFDRMVWYPNRKGYGYDICWWKERS